MNRFITIEDFVELIEKKSSAGILEKFSVLEDFDRLNIKNFITKLVAARLCHNVLFNILNEKDNDDYSSALKLKDIYDCHTCVIHIAQVYVKGIIPKSSSEDFIFGNAEYLTEDFAMKIVERLFNKNLRDRILEEDESENFTNVAKFSAEDLKDIKKYRIIDVREIPGNIPEFLSTVEGLNIENIPLKEIRKNPYMFGQDFSIKILLFCSFGVQSQLAYEILIKAGYKRVKTL